MGNPRPPLRIPGIAYLLAVLVVFFTVFGTRFASAPNLLNVGTQSSILLLLALPMTLIIMTEGLDLSMGAVMGLSGVVLAMLLVKGTSLPAAFAMALGVGTIFGIANGLLVVALEMPPFVATLGMLGVAEGIALVLTDGQSVVGIGSALPAVYSNRWLGIPFSIVVAVLAYAAFHYLLYHTRAGTYVFALGGNREALILAGVPANRYHVFIYLLGGLMAGMGAFLLTGRMSGGHPTAAIGMEFDAVVAVIIGGTKLERGDGWLPGSVLGVLTVGVLKNGLNVMAVPSSLQIASIGLLVIVALLMDSLRGNS
ncbi:MAG TPA: ABC transporter permease [Terriglobia bacterium]|nr:ABC transporter permease [Terriglobia bacterium]